MWPVVRGENLRCRPSAARTGAAAAGNARRATSWSSPVSTVLARSTAELLRIAEVIVERNGGLQSLEEPWADTTTPAGRMVLTMFAGVAEFERALIRHRTDEGRQAAMRRGVSFGRPQKLRPDQKTLALTLVQEGRSISEVARTFNVHPATIHRCLNAAQAP